MTSIINETKNLIKLIIIGILIMLMCSCKTTYLHYTGKYRITSLHGDTATFRGIESKYTIPPAGLKQGMKIKLNKTNYKPLANVIPVK